MCELGGGDIQKMTIKRFKAFLGSKRAQVGTMKLNRSIDRADRSGGCIFACTGDRRQDRQLRVCSGGKPVEPVETSENPDRRGRLDG